MGELELVGVNTSLVMPLPLTLILLVHIRAEEAVSHEIELVQNEAETFQDGFSKQIWPLAMQLKSALMQKEQSLVEEEEKRRDDVEENGNKGGESKSAGKQPEIIPLSKAAAPQKTGHARRRKHGNKS